MNTLAETKEAPSTASSILPGPKVGALYPQMLEIFQAMAQMNGEFKEGAGIDYLVRILMKVQEGESPELLEKRFLKAFSPTKNLTRLKSEYLGGITGAQKALDVLGRYGQELSRLASIVNNSATKVYAKDGLLCPDILSYCSKNRSKVGIRQWIGLSEALGYSREETTALVQQLAALAQYAEVLSAALHRHVKTLIWV